MTAPLRLDAATLEPRARLRRLILDRQRNAIGLDDRILVEDDAPAIGRPQGAVEDSWFERLYRGVVVRKDLVLDDARARLAQLVFCGREATGNTQPLHIRVNGRHVLRPPTCEAHPQARHYYTTDWGGAHFDNWFVVALPVDALRAGVNEIHLWAESEEASWEIMVAADQEYARGSEERTAHPDRSARSTDGGATWDFEHLGWQGLWDGEYCVRLCLDRHAADGLFRSPVIDLAGSGAELCLGDCGPLDGGPADESESGTDMARRGGGDTGAFGGPQLDDQAVLKRRVTVEECRIEWDLEIPAGGAAQIRVRLGPSPGPLADTWGDYEAVEGTVGKWQLPPGRYMQFEVDLSTTDPLQSPELRGIVIHRTVSPGIAPDACDAEAGCPNRHPVVVSCRNRPVVRSSYDYTWEDFGRLADLRKRFELDAVVAGAESEFDAQVRLMRWAYTVPLGELDRYAWRFGDLPRAQRDDNGRLVRLGPYERRRRDGHCLFCNLTLVAACLAMGYPARWVNVSTRHTYGHEVCEVWSNDWDKWVFLDATRDYYLYDPATNTPLGLTEVSERLGRVLPGAATWEYPAQHWLPNGVRAADMEVACSEGDHRFPVFDPQVGSEDLILIGHLQMPLRNDFASRPTPVPWRVSSNWGSDQFLCWYGQNLPRKEEYARQTRRWQDFNPTLNRVELCLSETEDSRSLRVEADTATPGFECFLVQVDDGEWSEQVEPLWEWALHGGQNRLAVRSRNACGVVGPASQVVVSAGD